MPELSAKNVLNVEKTFSLRTSPALRLSGYLYWLLEMYASLSRKSPVPVLLEPFSHEQPYSPGQNPVVLKGIYKILEITNNRGVLVAHRGFDAGVMFEDWLDNQ